MMKKWLALILAATITLSACGKSDEKVSLEKDIDKLEKEQKKLKKQKEEVTKERDKLKKEAADIEKEINAKADSDSED